MPRKPKVLFLVNGENSGAMGIRARGLSRHLDDFEVRIEYRGSKRIQSGLRFISTIVSWRPDVCYVMDMGYSGVLAAALCRMVRLTRVVIDTGDAIYDLARLSGMRRGPGLWLTKALEEIGFAMADELIVRSHYHQELLHKRNLRATVIQDGVDTQQFSPAPVSDLRQRLGIQNSVTIGVLGSLVWNDRWKMCYGWELIEVIRLLQDQPVHGLVIGDGSGLPHLKARCAAYGLEDRITFLGHQPYDALPGLLNAMDICLSTQTNDAAGRVRTTGKLPLYLACGRYVLATDVGEAARLLPPKMLVPYFGTKDETYPERLALRIQTQLTQPHELRLSSRSVESAGGLDYEVLSDHARRSIGRALNT